MKMMESYNHKLEATKLTMRLEATKTNHEAKFDELKSLIGGIAYQQTSFIQTLHSPIGEASSSRDKQAVHNGSIVARTCAS